jgi:hypothetical protein
MFRVVEATGKLVVFHKDTVVVDADDDALSRQSIELPDFDEIDHLEHPLAPLVGGILCVGASRNTHIGVLRDDVVLLRVANDVLVGRGIKHVIFAAAVLSTIVAAFGVDASVAVAIELGAMSVTVDAILLEAAFAAGSTEVWIVADSVLDRAGVVRRVILLHIARIIGVEDVVVVGSRNRCRPDEEAFVVGGTPKEG